MPRFLSRTLPLTAFPLVLAAALSLAVSDGRLFLRTAGHLYCIASAAGDSQ